MRIDDLVLVVERVGIVRSGRLSEGQDKKNSPMMH